MTHPKKILVFLSHSSRDKAFVKRLNSDLKSRSVDTWLDEQNIPLGGSITDSIQTGINKANVVLVFLSEASIASRWVNQEWQSKLFKDMSENRTSVLPVLLQDCEIPHFLADRRYLYFRKKDEYESNLSTLLAFLEEIKSSLIPETPLIRGDSYNSIRSITEDILLDLDLEQISLPTHRRMPIIDTLKSLPRSGKKVRLEHFRPELRIRSVYDHLISLAHVADCIFPHIEIGVKKEEYSDVAICIAYHELNEIVLGDIPTYTSLNSSRRNSARIYAEERLRTVSPSDRKRISNDFIWMFLSDKHRKAFEAANKILSDPNHPTFIAFKALDKIDPIISTWRYLHHYRGKIGENPKEFNRIMKDFYENPDVKSYLRSHKVDDRLLSLVLMLQDRAKAWDYYEDPSRVFGDASLFSMPSSAAQQAIEGIPLFTDLKPRQ